MSQVALNTIWFCTNRSNLSKQKPDWSLQQHDEHFKASGMFWVKTMNVLCPGEGQEVIIKERFCCSDSDGNVDHKRGDAGPQGWTGWRWVACGQNQILFSEGYTHTHTHAFLYWWMGKYAFLGLRALTSTETQNLDFLHTKAVLLFKKFNRTIQLSLKARPNQRAILQIPQ